MKISIPVPAFVARGMSRVGSFLQQRSGNAWTNMFGSDSPGGEVSMTQPLKQSAWVLDAVGKISKPIASVSVEFSLDPDFDTPLEKSLALKKWLRRPAVGFDWNSFMMATVGWRKTGGECFWLLDDKWMLPHLDVVDELPPLILARPDRMRHIEKDGKIVGWAFRDAKGRESFLPPEQVVHPKQWNPYDDYRGLGNLEAARNAAETDWLGSKMFRSLMRDNGDRGQIVIAKQGITDVTQRDQIIAMLREATRKRRRGEPAPLFLTNDVTIEDAKLFTPDAAFWQGRLESRKEIFAAFGIPLSMADTQVSYSIGSASDYYRLILDTCMPEAEAIADGLERIASLLQGQPVYCRFDWDEHPVMQEVRKERLGSVDTLWGKGMPMAEVSDYLNLGLPRYKGDDLGYLPFSVSPVGSSDWTDPSFDPSFGEEPPDEKPVADPLEEEPAVQAMLRALSKPRTKAADTPEEEAGKEFQQKRDPKELSFWRSQELAKRAYAKAFKVKFDKQLFKARAEVLAKIARLEGKAIGQRSVAADFLFNLADWKFALLADMRGPLGDTLEGGGKSIFAELKSEDAFTAPAPFVQQFIRERENYLSGVADSVFGQIKGELNAGIQAGETMAQLSGRVKRAFKGVSDERAVRIAQNETGIAYAKGREAGMKQAGIQYKMWLTSGNDNVRAAHRQINKQVVPVNQPFVFKDGSELMHPGDSSMGADLDHTINCHCISIPVEGPEG